MEVIKMSEEEAIDFTKYYMRQYFYEDISIEDDFKFEKAIETVLQLLEEQDTRIDELKKALIEEQLKHTEKINDAIKWLETLQSGGTSCNCGDLQLVLDILEE